MVNQLTCRTVLMMAKKIVNVCKAIVKCLMNNEIEMRDVID